MERIVTGEGVALESRPASAISRLLAALLDLVVYLIVFWAGMWLLATVSLVSSDASSILAISLVALVTVVIPTTVETVTRGRSVGKLAVGIRVVRDDGGPEVFRQAFVRALVGVVELWMTAGSIALICSMFNAQGKRVGDILAGTYAIRVREAAQLRAPVAMPPWLGPWAAGADIARLPDGLALSVRQFLARANRLHPASRVQLGSQLTAEAQRYVHPLPPPGTHPEAFLAAVLAERRQRETVAQLRTRSRDVAEARLLHRLPYGIPDPVD